MKITQLPTVQLQEKKITENNAKTDQTHDQKTIAVEVDTVEISNKVPDDVHTYNMQTLRTGSGGETGDKPN